MKDQTWQKVFVVAIFTVLVITFMNVTQAFPRAATTRPAGVPDGFVITPFGYFHPSCVNQLAKGDVLRADEKAIHRSTGTVDKIPACAYAHYRGDGEKVIGDERALQTPDISHSWVIYASVTTSSAYGALYTFWNVPPAPKKDDGQTIFFFNGMEQSSGDVTILQPVLGWNNDYSNAWSIASWNCCVNGAVNEATPQPASSGDLIYGYLYNNCAAGTEVCSSWDVITWDLTSRNYSELTATTNYGQTFNWAFGGVVEVYNVLKCADYPDGPADTYVGGGPLINFYNQWLYNDEFDKVAKPAWQITKVTGLSPNCSSGGSLPEEVSLTY